MERRGQRRAVIDSMFFIYVDPVGISAPRRFDPERVRFEPKGQD